MSFRSQLWETFWKHTGGQPLNTVEWLSLLDGPPQNPGTHSSISIIACEAKWAPIGSCAEVSQEMGSNPQVMITYLSWANQSLHHFKEALSRGRPCGLSGGVLDLEMRSSSFLLLPLTRLTLRKPFPCFLNATFFFSLRDVNGSRIFKLYSSWSCHFPSPKPSDNSLLQVPNTVTGPRASAEHGPHLPCQPHNIALSPPQPCQTPSTSGTPTWVVCHSNLQKAHPHTPSSLCQPLFIPPAFISAVSSGGPTLSPCPGCSSD